MEKLENNKSPLHLVRCLGELCVMYAHEKTRQFNNFVDDAMDVYGEEE